MDRAYKLKKEYSLSGVPTFIADEELKIIWKNNLKSHVLKLGESADVIFDGGMAVTGLVSRKINGELNTFNVIKTEDGADGKVYYIIELVSSGRLSAEAVREYIGHICSKIRTAAEDITSVIDRLFEDISAGALDPKRASEGFERIYESAAALEREVFYPDGIYSLIDSKRLDDIIILDKEMIAVVSGIKSSLKSSFGEKLRISEDYDRDIFFRMNADTFETAVALMAAECCQWGSYPERMIFSARRSGRDRAEVTVMSLDIGRKTGVTKSGQKNDPHAYEEGRSFNRRLLAEYIYDVLGMKNGARFSKENIPGGIVYRMNIETLPRGALVFAEKPVDGLGRRCAIAEKLAFFFGDAPGIERRSNTYRGSFDEYGNNDSEP